jgi:hypothetical protein
MLSSIIDGLKSVITLRAEARKDRKVGLEIKALEDQRRLDDLGIVKPSMDQILEFDPKARKIRQMLTNDDERARVGSDYECYPSSGLFWKNFILVLLIALGFFIYVIWNWMHPKPPAKNHSPAATELPSKGSE